VSLGIDQTSTQNQDALQSVKSNYLRILLAVLFVLPLGSWLAALGNPVAYFQYELPPGQVLYILSKLLGLYAILLLWLQLMYGLLKNDALLRAVIPRWSISIHRLLGLSTLLMTSLHFVVFFIATSIRKGAVAVQLLVPDFGNGYYSTTVSLGWLALVGLWVVAVAGIARARGGHGWIGVHRLAIAVGLLALTHSLLVGSETKTTLWLIIYFFFGVTILGGVFRRIRSLRRSRGVIMTK